MSDSKMRIALLIDADNAPASRIDVILAEVARHGSADVRLAYGDWQKSQLKRWRAALDKHGIKPAQQAAFTKGKNATDMAMVIGAMDLLHGGAVEGFALVSSDADFTPLVKRLRGAGHQVFGFGEKKTPRPFRDACTKFTLVDVPVKRSTQLKQLVKPAPRGIAPKPKVRDAKISGDTRLIELLRAAVVANKAKSGWANLGNVRNQLGNESSFDQRSYGFRKFSALMLAIGHFEIRRVGLVAQVRVKPNT